MRKINYSAFALSRKQTVSFGVDLNWLYSDVSGEINFFKFNQNFIF